MSAAIGMNDIPFAPLLGDLHVPKHLQLGDNIPPPIAPHAPLPVKRPVDHCVIAWRQDGGMNVWKHATLELAQEQARNLQFAVYWKYVIQCGREMCERVLIAECQTQL